jgi:hypothetical protein
MVRNGWSSHRQRQVSLPLADLDAVHCRQGFPGHRGLDVSVILEGGRRVAD